VLQEYAGQPADHIRFVTNPFGKPSVVGATEVWFNLSHADDLAVVAVSREAEIGVDVEAIQPNFNSSEMTRCFTVAELAQMREGSASVFFKFWTRKEAVLKAEGTGLSIGLTNIDVSRAPNELVKVETDSGRLWRVNDLEAADGYAGALAGPPGEWLVRYRHLL
jgi:4'-phosphopantetheinyl transferase